MMAAGEASRIHVFEWSPRVKMDPWHSHDHLELGYCHRGSGTFQFGGKTYRAAEGDVFVVNNLERHAAASDAADPSVYYFVYFDPYVLERVDPQLLQPYIYRPARFTNRIPASEPAAREIGELVGKLWREHTGGQLGSEGIVVGLLVQISGLLLRYYGQQASDKDWSNALSSYYRLREALDYIRANLAEPIALEDVARAMNLSASRARHFIKEKIGEGFKEYLTRVRIDEARKLLATTSLPVTEIMHECGYGSHAPFYRSFQAAAGMSPLQYRERVSKIALFENRGPLA